MEKPADISAAGGVNAGAEGGDIGILAGFNGDIAGQHADSVRHHLRLRGIGALPDLRFAALEHDPSARVQDHPAGGGLQGDGVDCRVIPEDGTTDASADRAGLVLVLLQLCRSSRYTHGHYPYIH